MKTATEIFNAAKAARRNMTNILKIVIDNTANGATDQAVSLFDATGACGSTQDDDAKISVNYKGGIAGLRKKLQGSNLAVAELNYQVTTSSTQFGQAFTVRTGGIGNKVEDIDISADIANGRRPANQDDKCRIVDFPCVLHAEMDWVPTVAAGEKVILCLTIVESSQFI